MSGPKDGRAKRKLGEQIAEVERELAQRKRVYERLVREGKLTQKLADYQTECLEDARASLLWLKDNREACIEWWATQLGADPVTGEVAG